jgi:hypothetical protein
MCFGSDASVGGLRFQMSTAIKTNVARIHQARAAGVDCKDLGIGGASAGMSAAPSKQGKGQTSSFLVCFAQHSI